MALQFVNKDMKELGKIKQKFGKNNSMINVHRKT